MYSAEAFDLLATTVLLLNASGEVVEANAAAEVMFGRSRRNLLGQPAAFLFDREGKRRRWIDGRRSSGHHEAITELSLAVTFL